MQFEYELTEEAANEIDLAIQRYEDQFSSGAADFLSAYDDTLSAILHMPEAGKRKSKKDVNVRGRDLKSNPGSKSYAKQFPYQLLYKVYEAENKVVIFQLWPTKSNVSQRETPEE